MYRSRRSGRRTRATVNPYDSEYSASNLTQFTESGQLPWLSAGMAGLTDIVAQNATGSTGRRRRGGRRNTVDHDIAQYINPAYLQGSQAATVTLPSSVSSFVSPVIISGGVGASQKGMNDKPVWNGTKKLYDAIAGSDMLNDLKIGREKIITDGIQVDKLNNAPENKDKIFLFSNDRQTDSYAETLAPDFGGPLYINVPAKVSYPSPVHYVESMKMLTSSSPATLLAGNTIINSGIPMTPCDFSRISTPQMVRQPYASVITGVARACDNQALKQKFYEIDSVIGKFWASLWIGLWAKFYKYPKYASILAGTGTKLLVFDNEDTIYGTPNGTSDGINAVGVLLMFIRAFVNAGYIVRRTHNPLAFFDKYVKPILLKMYKMDSDGKLVWI